MRIILLILAAAACFLVSSVFPQGWEGSLVQADSLYAAGERDSAILLASSVLHRTERQFGVDHLVTARILRAIASYHAGGADFQSAVLYHKRALTILEKRLPSDDTAVATVCFELAGDYLYQQKLDLAAPLFYQSLQIREKSLGSDHPEVARSLNAVAAVLIHQQKFQDALPYSEQALAVWERTLGPEHPNTAKALTNIAIARNALGDLNTAESLYVRLLNIREKQLGPGDPEIAILELGLGRIRYERGDYAEARPHMERAIAIRRANYGDTHLFTVQAKVDLATVLYAQANYSMAEQLFLAAIAAFDNSGGQSGISEIGALQNLADMYQETGRYSDAIRLLEKALSLSRALLGENCPRAGELTSLLADVTDLTGHHHAAESLYMQAHGILEGAYGPRHHTLIATLNGLAITLSKQGKFDQAEPVYQRALNLGKGYGGTVHRVYANSLEYYAGHLQARGSTDSAGQLLLDVLDVRQSEFRSLVSVLPERHALEYGSLLRKSFDHFLSVFMESSDQTASAEAVATVILRGKGAITDQFIERHRLLRRMRRDTSSAVAALTRAKQSLSCQFVRGESGDPGTITRQDSLTHLIDSLEEQIARADSVRMVNRQPVQLTLKEVQSRIPPGSALIEYVRYTRFSPLAETGVDHYLAIVLQRTGSPLVAELGLASGVDSTIRAYRTHFDQVANRSGTPGVNDLAEYRRIARALADRVWRPLQSALPDSGLLMISPDGLINLVSFAGLSFAEDQYLAERYTVKYLSSGRDMLKASPTGSRGQGLLAIGDPDFDATPEQIRGNQATMKSIPMPTSATQLRSSLNDCLDLGNLNVQRLPGTRSEIDLITGLWRKAHSGTALQLIGESASEESFKIQASGKRVIHLATHGYYTPPYCKVAVSGHESVGQSNSRSINPLLTSGLFLAGANRNRERADTTGDDGILTAEEVSVLDLSGTAMVVLSSCESGLGEIASGEGVYGLRRAFLMAGAEGVISSLWPVPDNVTAQLMSSIYAQGGDGSRFQLRQGMLDLLDRLRKRGQPDHPFLWASFVSTGDWQR